MFICNEFPGVRLNRYILNNSSEFILTELIGRSSNIKAVKSKFIMCQTIDFTSINNGSSLRGYYNLRGGNVRSNSSVSADGVASAVIVNETYLDDIFAKDDEKKFMEILRRKTATPVADEWAGKIYGYFKEEGAIEELDSNIGDFYTVGDKNIDELIAGFLDKEYNSIKINTKKKSSGVVPESISKFVQEYKDELSKMVMDKCDVLYKGEDEDRIDYSPILSKFIPYLPQQDVANAVSKRLLTKNSVIISAEMGCGKTLMSLMSIYAYYKRTGKKNIKCLLMLPPHLMNKWEREAKKVFGGLLNNIAVLRKISDVDALRRTIGDKTRQGIEIYLVSRETAKLSYYWKHAGVIETSRKVKDQRESKILLRCPKCGYEQEGNKGSKNYCKNVIASNGGRGVCNEPLWQATSELRRVAIMEYAKKKLPGGFFDFFVLDEAHEEKGDSARGIAAGHGSSMAKKSIWLTGTLSGGKPSTLHYILWRTNPSEIKKIADYNEPMKTALNYGVVETIRKGEAESNKMSRNNKQTVVMKEKPGISPKMLTDYFFDNTVFMKIEDLRADLPPYAEYVDVVELDPVHKENYNDFRNQLEDEVRKSLFRGSLAMLSKMLISLTAYADNPIDETVFNGKGEPVATSCALDITTAKERILMEIVNENMSRGRKSLIYCEFTNKRDIQERLKEKLDEYGIRAVILPSKIKPELREKWITDNLKEADVMICNPRLVSTGLDLYDFPTIIFYQTGYSTYLLRQASRRSWRIGQSQPVEVHFLVNQGTVQESAMKLIADKMTSAQIFEGELPEGGLEELSQIEEKSFVKTLAEGLVNGSNVKGSLEDMWKAKMASAVESDDLLSVDTPKPVTKRKTAVKAVNETVIESNRGGSEKMVFTVISNVELYPDKAASFTVDNQMYLMKEGRVYKVSGIPNDMSKTYAGKYVWKISKKTNNRYAECYIKDNVIYVGKQDDKFLAFKIAKSLVA
jgi:superfamily II DNA or RNA helicase